MTAKASMLKARVLYVDDDMMNLDSFKAAFRRNYDVFLAGSAKKALDILMEKDIQVLITDQRMPGMTGSELLELVEKQYPHTLRFMLTGFSDFHPLADAINKGRLMGYFSKPIDHELITHRIENELKRYHLEMENRKLLERIRQSESFLNAIIENIPDVIFVKDAEKLSFVRFNRAGQELFGYSPEEMIGKTDYDLFPVEEADFFTQKDRQVLESKSLIDIPEETVQTRFKGKRWIHTKKIPILTDDGKAMYLLGVSRDITEYRELLENEKKLEARLRQAQKMEAIGTLAGGIAHDFNNILTSIIGYTDLAFEYVEKGSQVERFLREVYAGGNRAKELVKQILTVARQSKTEQIPVQVGMIGREALKLIRSSLPATIRIQQHLESGAMVLGDPTHIHQIFMNLCTNAAHAMGKEGGELTVRLSDVTIGGDFHGKSTALSPGGYILIQISDTGVGIAEKDLEQIFEPYYTTKEVGVGTGLGLAVVHGIVKTYGGEITVESRSGKGSVFGVYLPAIRIQSGAETETYPILQTGNERILFIDDETVIANMCREILDHLGYKVTAAFGSIEALELFKNHSREFDLVITDMTMPNMAGDRLSIELMKIRPDIPVILCTGYSKHISETSAAEIGIKALLMKPLSKMEMARTVRKVLDDTARRV